MNRSLIILVVVLVLLLTWMSIRYQRASIQATQLSSVINEKNDSIHYHKNENGKVVAQKVAAELRAKDLEKAYPEIAESIRKELGIEIRNLKAYIKNEFSARGGGTGTTVTNNYYDTATQKRVYFRDFSMDDGHLTFSTRVYDSLKTSPYRYLYQDTAQTAIASNKKFWQVWKDERLYATTMFSNPNAKINGTTSILVNNYRDKRWVLSVGGYVDPIRQQAGVSINFGYALIKF